MSTGSGATPQFETAEYPGDRCAACHAAIGKTYYRVNGAMSCPACADRARFEQPKESGGAFAKALIFGAGAAIAGLALYATVGIVTGLEIGYVSLAVGFMVGRAMMMGSHGFGGRKYQIAAVLLTYAAVSMAQVPIGLWQIAHHPHSVKTAPAASSGSKAPESSQATSEPAEKADAGSAGAPQPESKPMSLGVAILILAGIGLASPFFGLSDPLHGIIGLVILVVGIRIAWQIAAGMPRGLIDGPFENSPAVSA